MVSQSSRARICQNNLGVMYDTGTGVEMNYAEAVKLYTQAATQGYATAQNNLGFMYYYGKGVVRDYEKAVAWFREAAAQGDVHAYYYLGNCYLEGTGVSRDKDLAIRWFIKAAKMGHPRAIAFFRRYAEIGHAEAQVIMGLIHYKGQGVVQDYKKSVIWLRKAVLQGHSDAKTYMDALCSEKPKACE